MSVETKGRTPIQGTKMATKNDITGDKIQTKPNSNHYRNNFDAIDWSATRSPKKDEKPDAKAFSVLMKSEGKRLAFDTATVNPVRLQAK